MTRQRTVALCYSRHPFEDGDKAWAVRVALCLTERGHQIDLVTVPMVGADADSIVATALRWRSVELRRVGRTRVDLAVCGDAAAAFVGHPSRVIWLERHDHESGGLAAALSHGSDTAAGRLTASAIANAAAVVVGSRDDGLRLGRRFEAARGKVTSADEYLSSLPVLVLAGAPDDSAKGGSA